MNLKNLKQVQITDDLPNDNEIELTNGKELIVADEVTQGFAGEPVYWTVLLVDGKPVSLADIKEFLKEKDLDIIMESYRANKEANESVDIYSYI